MLGQKKNVLRTFLGICMLLSLLGMTSCAERETISFDEFITHVQNDKVSGVTIIKPADPENQPTKVEGMYRGSIEGKSTNVFSTEGKVDEGVIEQLKGSGVNIKYKN